MNKFKAGYYTAAVVSVVALGSVVGVSLNAIVELTLLVKAAI